MIVRWAGGSKKNLKALLGNYHFLQGGGPSGCGGTRTFLGNLRGDQFFFTGSKGGDQIFSWGQREVKNTFCVFGAIFPLLVVKNCPRLRRKFSFTLIKFIFYFFLIYVEG